MDANLFRQRAAALHVVPRQDENYRGGWPLGYIGPQCPADTPVVCKRSTDEEPQGCCPQGQFCMTTISEVYCCPTEADCGTAVTNRPVCANPAWTLFGLTSNRYFCCPSGYFGVKSVELSGRGLCEPNLDGLPTTRIASTITRGTPATTGTAAGSGGSGGSGQTTSPGGSPGSTGTSSNSAGGSGGGGSVSAGVIAGSVVGGVALLLLGIALVLWLHRKSLRRNPGPGPGPGPGPTPETKLDPSPPPPQSSPSPGMITQHQYQHPSTPQFGSPAVATPPPQYAYPQPPEADGVGRFEMPVHAQELPSHIGPRSR